MSGDLRIRVMRIEGAPRAELPHYATHGAAGMDVRAALTEPLTLAAGERFAVPTGLVFEVPHGFEVQVRPRSGLALRHGLTCINAPGTIDSDYRGEVKILLANLGNEPVTINHGDRVAQLIVAPVSRAQLVEVESLTETARGEGGFGHTGHE
ncbi:dUTP diphosphatase [bacterium]|nr:dUTP diphosphatase [bacterium]